MADSILFLTELLGLKVFAALGAAVLISGHRVFLSLRSGFASKDEPQLSTQAYRLLNLVGWRDSSAVADGGHSYGH